jgi:hypothetical protein
MHITAFQWTTGRILLAGVLAIVAVTLVSALARSPHAAAARPNPVVELTLVSSTEGPDGCSWQLLATWDSAESRGPTVDTRLYESVDGGAPALIAGGFGIEDTGERLMTVADRQAGSYVFEFVLQKGTHKVLSSATLAADCPAA